MSGGSFREGCPWNIRRVSSSANVTITALYYHTALLLSSVTIVKRYYSFLVAVCYTPLMETQKPAEATVTQATPPSVPVPNPLADLVSHFEDDPDWDVMMASIRRHRREMDAVWDSAE